MTCIKLVFPAASVLSLLNILPPVLGVGGRQLSPIPGPVRHVFRVIISEVTVQL